MGTAETGGVRVSLFPPSGGVCAFSSLFFFFCELASHIFSEVDSELKLDFFKASILPYLGLSFPIGEGRGGEGRCGWCITSKLHASSEMP